MPALFWAAAKVIGLVGLGAAGTYQVMKGPDDDPVTADERKGARTKYIVAGIGAVGVWAYFKFRRKK
ncbi:hypothetical protein [Terasakiella sp. SH-1]|uniref:hypothetical protein n=1 Tax=Terasakiella sp. SH-1 TaxID=2560057 RepID=UPI001074374F|nr:hypothetical protein [Terasakiella sp. SH-1]